MRYCSTLALELAVRKWWKFTKTHTDVDVFLCNQFSGYICLSLSFSAPFSFSLSLSLSCWAAIDRPSRLEVNPWRTPDSFVDGGYRGDPPWPWAHRGLVRGQAETISPLQSDKVKGRRRTVRSTWMWRLLGRNAAPDLRLNECVMDPFPWHSSSMEAFQIESVSK